MNELQDYEYKVTYLNDSMCCAFVRVADDAILYSSNSEQLVATFAEGFCAGSGKMFYRE